MDVNLQRRIAKSDNFNFDAADAIKSLLDTGPTPLRNDLKDWNLEESNGYKALFYKGKNYVPKDDDL
jgi:hypothetical protein